MTIRRKINIQETKLQERPIEVDITRYKIWYTMTFKYRNGICIIEDQNLMGNVVELKKIKGKIIGLKVL